MGFYIVNEAIFDYTYLKQAAAIKGNLMKLRNEYTCPLELTHDVIKGKWKPIILWQLSKQSSSLSGLKREIAGISQKMLVQHLNDLITYGIVQKKLSDHYPLLSDYSLTDRGRKLFEAVCIMQSVGIDMMIEDGKRELLEEKGLI